VVVAVHATLTADARYAGSPSRRALEFADGLATRPNVFPDAAEAEHIGR
jgi:hypothetical protein